MASLKVLRSDNSGLNPTYDYYLDGLKLVATANKTGFINCLNKFVLLDGNSDLTSDWSYLSGVITEANSKTTINLNSVALTLSNDGELIQGTPTDIVMKIYLIKTQFDSRPNRPATISNQGDLTW